jgi:ERCC4-related helicase
LLIYTNNKDNAIKVRKYVESLTTQFDMSDLSYSEYHSDMNSNLQKSILDKFNKSKYGIISTIYCLGEGYDNNIIDAVVFAENMSSNIRIVQSALRAGRKNRLEPNKITKIILPILNQTDWLENNDNQDLRKT